MPAVGKRKINKFVIFIIVLICIVYGGFFYIVIGPYIPYKRSHFKDYQKFYDTGYHLTMPNELPEFCKNIKYHYHHGAVTQKAFYCTVDNKNDIFKLRDRLEKEHGTLELVGYYDPKWLKTTMRKKSGMDFVYVYPSFREDKKDVNYFELYCEKIKPVAAELIENDEGWYCVSLYEDDYSNHISTFGIMANENNEVIEFSCSETVFVSS